MAAVWAESPICRKRVKTCVTISWENTGSSAEESQSSREMQFAARGKAVGLDFNFYDSMRMVNSRHLHVLLDFALAHGKQTELKLRFFTA